MSKLRLCSAVLSLVLFGGCTKKAQPTHVPMDPSAVRIGLVLDKGGKDDKSFNAAALKGAQDATKEFGLELKVIESPDDASYEPAMRSLAEKGFNLVITVGFGQADALKKIAPLHPKTHFAIVDSFVDVPNVASLLFAEHEGSFLVGYLAALKTKSNIVGFIGGMDVDLIKRFELGYRTGVKYANSKIQILVNYAGMSSDAWMNPTKGKELALSQINRGADVIYTAAGATNSGVFDAVEEKNKLAIGVDSNQNWVKPGFILTSMLKRVDLAVYNIVKAEKEGRFIWGNKFFGLADRGVDYALDSYNEKLVDADLKKALEKVRADILSGKIVVPDYYQTRSLCPENPMNCHKKPRSAEAPRRTAQ